MKPLDIKSIIIGMMGATIIFLVTGANKNNVHLQVRRLDLVNEAGELCAVLNSMENGGASLSLGSLEKGSKFDERFTVVVDRSKNHQGGTVYMDLGGDRGSLRLTNEYSGAGPLLYMMNSEGKFVLAAGVSGDPGKGYVRINDHTPSDNEVSLKIKMKSIGEGENFMIVGDEGDILWSAPAGSK